MIHSPIHFSHKLPSIQLSNPKKQCEILFLQKNPSIEKKEKFPVIGNNRYNNTKLLLLKKSTDSNRSSQTNDCSSLLRQNSSGSGTKSKNWKKVSNIIRSISLLRQHETREIKNEKEFENDLKDYDIAFNAMHGKYGEDGCIQGILELLKIKKIDSNEIVLLPILLS